MPCTPRAAAFLAQSRRYPGEMNPIKHQLEIASIVHLPEINRRTPWLRRRKPQIGGCRKRNGRWSNDIPGVIESASKHWRTSLASRLRSSIFKSRVLVKTADEEKLSPTRRELVQDRSLRPSRGRHGFQAVGSALRDHLHLFHESPQRWQTTLRPQAWKASFCRLS